MLDTNVLGLCIATREALKSMKKNDINDGHVIHINSVAGHWVPFFDGISIYPASKHAVTALTETLRQELISKGSKIRVTVMSVFFYRRKAEFKKKGLTVVEYQSGVCEDRYIC